MGSFSKLKKTVKRGTALLLTGLLAAACVDASVLTTSVSAAGDILSNEARGVIFADSRSDFRDESIYFLITTRFYDGDSSNNTKTSEDTKAKNPDSDPSWRGDFKGLIEKLDYIKALGFTAIWITPVVENNSGYDYHGYHASNFKAVDNRYESNGVTYQTLIDACHDKGIKVIQDVVFNHTCNFGEKGLIALGGDALKNQITSDVYPTRNQVVMNGTGDPNNIYHHNGFCGGGDWDNFEAQRKTIADDCFDLNTENPTVYNYLVDAYKGYIDMGVDGFRVDTVKHISRLTLNTAILPELTAEAKKTGNNNFYMFGEVCTKGHDVWYRDAPPISTAFYTWDKDDSYKAQWSSTDQSANNDLVAQHYTDNMNTGSQPTSNNAFLNGNNYRTVDYSSKSDMNVIDFQMHWSFMNANSAFNTALGQDKYFNDSTWNVVYVDSHDYGPDECQTQRYTGGTDAWAENLDLMFTFRGIPCVYYGSEIEFQKGMPIDVGPNAPLSQTGRAYFGDHLEGTVESTGFTVFNNLSGEVKSTLNSKLSQHIMRLNRIRQAVPALRKGQYSTEGCSGNMAFKRRYTDSKTDSFALVAISGNATFTGIPGGTYIDAVTGDTKTVSEGGSLTASCSGKGQMRVYVLSTSKTPAPGRVIPNGDYINDGGAAELIGEATVITDIIEDTGISLSSSAATVFEGETTSLTATVTPSNATYKSVKWTSSDNSVATVNGGTVTGVSIGTATITATSHSGKTATCKVTVKENPNIVKPTGVTIAPTTLTVSEGGTGTLTATVTPSNATNKTVTWSSSNENVATVSGGTVTGVGSGTATITATTSNGLKATANVTVSGKTYPKISAGVYFEKPASWGSNLNAYIYDGATDTTVGAAWPGTAMKQDSASGVYYLEYSTTSTTLKIIFNDGNNQIPGSQQPGFDYKNLGLYDSNGFVKIIDNSTVDVTSVFLNKTSAALSKGGTVTLSATINPSNATDKSIAWSSSNTSVATVSGGVVTAVAKGTATITASSNNGKTATCTITVSEDDPIIALSNNSTLSSTQIAKGSSVTVKCAASGGTSPYQYKVSYKKSSSSSWTVKQAYSSTSSVSITPNPSETTTYNVKVDAKDSAGTVKSKTLNVTVTVSPSALTNNSTVSATSVSLGSSVTVKGAATGGSGSYQYAVYYKKTSASSWTTVQAYKSNSTVTIKPTTATTYDLCVKVKDSKGTIAKKYFTLKFVNPPANNSTISATTIKLGSTVTVKAAATGGVAPYQYGVYYKKASSDTWSTAQAYSTNATVTIKPSTATTYDICVKSKDSKNTIIKKYFTLKVTKAELSNTSTLSATSVNLGSSVTVKASATGGSGTYQYGVYYKKATSETWSTVQSYKANATVTIKPSTGVTYDVCVKVKDSSGTIAKKYFTLKVVDNEFRNTSTVSATSTTGTSVTVTTSCKNGTSPYFYKVETLLSGANEWATVSDFAGTSTVKVPLSKAGTYQIRVTAADVTGNTSVKYLTVVKK